MLHQVQNRQNIICHLHNNQWECCPFWVAGQTPAANNQFCLLVKQAAQSPFTWGISSDCVMHFPQVWSQSTAGLHTCRASCLHTEGPSFFPPWALLCFFAILPTATQKEKKKKKKLRTAKTVASTIERRDLIRRKVRQSAAFPCYLYVTKQELSHGIAAWSRRLCNVGRPGPEIIAAPHTTSSGASRDASLT